MKKNSEGHEYIHYVYFEKKDSLENRSKSVFKYISTFYALSALKRQKLRFCNPAKWTDPFEKRSVGLLPAGGNRKVFCLCVSDDPNCEASWKLYSNGKGTMRFALNWNVLMEVLKQYASEYDIYVGKVKYVKRGVILSDEEQLLQKCSVKNREVASFFLKRESYRYEREIRILLVGKDRNGQAESKDDSLDISFGNRENLVRRVVLSPFFEKGEADIVKTILQDYFQIRKVYLSSLYEEICDYNEAKK